MDDLYKCLEKLSTDINTLNGVYKDINDIVSKEKKQLLKDFTKDFIGNLPAIPPPHMKTGLNMALIALKITKEKYEQQLEG